MRSARSTGSKATGAFRANCACPTLPAWCACAPAPNKDRCRFDTRDYASSAALTAQRAAEAVRGHRAIENSPHWVLDVLFADDQPRLRKGHGARTMAIVRHFAINLVRSAPDPVRPELLKPQRRPKPGATPRPVSLKRRRKIASWNSAGLNTVMAAQTR